MAKKKLGKRIAKQALDAGQKAYEKAAKRAGWHFDFHVVGRFSKLARVRRPVIAWLTLILVLSVGVFIQTRQLSSHYIAEVPIHGGVLREGMVGEVTNANPIYATSTADASLSKLIFSSLVEFNDDGKIVGDLARKWSASRDGKTYKFTLRDNAFWHDGEPLTAEDVEFTFDMLTHPDANSPLAGSWRGVKVTASGEHTVTIKLPNPFAPFLDSLSSIGIIPKHILEDVRPEQLRGHRFNLTNPVGSGPFKFIDSLAVGGFGSADNGIIRFRLSGNQKYHAGAPRLDSLHLFVYRDREQMLNDYNEGQLALISGLVAADIPHSGTVAERLSADAADEALIALNKAQITLDSASSNVHSVPRTSIVMLFFNMRSGLFSNADIRAGMAQAVNRQDIVGLSDNQYLLSRSVLLPHHLGYRANRLQPDINITKAAQALNRAGWKLAGDGWRYRKDKRLKFTIISQAEDIFPEVLAALRQQFKQVGADVQAKLVSAETIQQDYLAEHDYQAVLYGINVGFDADQFAFWHSSQAGTNGRNLSGYSSSVADAALEAGRTRLEKNLRREKYFAFVNRWNSDTPAISLYQPTFIYASKKQVRGVELEIISQAADRYHNVEDWTVNTGRAEKLY